MSFLIYIIREIQNLPVGMEQKAPGSEGRLTNGCFWSQEGLARTVKATPTVWRFSH